ncbi:MAG: hypothetical protein ACJ796_17230 [Gemmatimonadaceae bacterium]
MSSVARLSLILVAGFVSGAAITHRACAQDSGFVAWPRELVSRAPAVADGMTREFGQAPRMIAFGGRDSMNILFWNPTVWQDAMDSRVLPEKSLPMVRAAMKDVAAYVWTTFARDAGVQSIRVAFVRVVHDKKYLAPTHEQPAQEVSGMFSRQMLETGQLPMVAIAQREGGALDERTQKMIDSLKAARSRHAALSDAIERDIGELTNEISVKGRDTLEVVFWNPRLWWKDDFSRSLPEESLPVVRQAAKRTAQGVWERYGREAGMNVVRIRFERMYSEPVKGVRVMKPAQVVTSQFTRQQLETGQLDPVQLAIIQK